MREIKFRLWNEEEKYMQDPKSIYSMVEYYDIIDPEAIIMQFTGIKDKNNIEIYEGDIVVKFEEIGFISYKHSYFVMNTKNGDSIISKNVEVIGNIYQNKELLNERD